MVFGSLLNILLKDRNKSPIYFVIAPCLLTALSMLDIYVKQNPLFKCGNVSLKVSTKQPANQLSNFLGWILT